MNRAKATSSALPPCWRKRRAKPAPSPWKTAIASRYLEAISPFCIERKPHAGMDLLTTLGHQLHAAQKLVRLRATRNANEIIEKQETFGEHVADAVAGFGGSWTFIIAFAIVLTIYTTINVLLGGKAWDPYPFILLNLFLSMLAAIQAPVIMMSQNRQDTKDRVRSELDFDVNRRSETEIQGLARKLNLLDEKLGDIYQFVKDARVPSLE